MHAQFLDKLDAWTCFHSLVQLHCINLYSALLLQGTESAIQRTAETLFQDYGLRPADDKLDTEWVSYDFKLTDKSKIPKDL